MGRCVGNALQVIRDMQGAPTETDLIKETIDVLTNSSAPIEEILVALEALQSLIEPIDNANSKSICIWCSQHCSPMHVRMPAACFLIR